MIAETEKFMPFSSKQHSQLQWEFRFTVSLFHTEKVIYYLSYQNENYLEKGTFNKYLGTVKSNSGILHPVINWFQSSRLR